VVFEQGDIDGVHIKKLMKHVDERGFLIETYRIDVLPEGLQPQMSYVSFTEPGVARGPHEHSEQTDVFAFIGPGTLFIKLWDNRKGSNTYRNCMEILGGEDNPLLVVIPPGVVHGYMNTSKSVKGMVLNFPDRLFKGWGKKEPVDEIRHEDQADDFYLDFVSGAG
jgi:dTDP-4-dehydrorhamnose 3,5-epimerase